MTAFSSSCETTKEREVTLHCLRRLPLWCSRVPRPKRETSFLRYNIVPPTKSSLFLSLTLQVLQEFIHLTSPMSSSSKSKENKERFVKEFPGVVDELVDSLAVEGMPTEAKEWFKKVSSFGLSILQALLTL